MKRTLIFCILWMLFAAAIFYTTLILNISFNLFSWHFHMDTFVFMMMLLIIVLIVAGLVLAKHTIGRIEIGFSFLIAVSLMVFGIIVMVEFYSESISSDFLGRSTFSPHWFRVTVFTVNLTAIIFWFVYPFNYLKLNHDSVLKSP